MDKDILNADSAKDFVLKHLKYYHSYKWKNVQPINNGRYWLIEGSAINENVGILYKRDWFYKFGDMARQLNWKNESGKEESGIGDSINKEDLKTMLINKIERIYIIHRTGEIYSIRLHDFLIYSHDWTNKEGKEVKSISIHRYNRVNKDE